MPGFLKVMLASLLAMFVFSLLVFFFFLALAGSLAAGDKPKIAGKTVLQIDLSQQFAEQQRKSTFGFAGKGDDDVPGLYDLVNLIHAAKTDKRIEGIYLLANSNPNGFASSEEIRRALEDFKSSGKFILAYGDMISQKAYSVANIANKIYVHPQGYMEWDGFNVEYTFLKGTLQKLEIEPQIFYAGKFKSATEPFRTDKMSPENQLQTSVWLNDLYNDFLIKTATARKIDTAVLRQLAVEAKIQKPADAVAYKLADAVKYDDEVKDEIRKKLGLGKYEKINFATINTYMTAKNLAAGKGEKIALIFAEGNIVDGKGDDQGTISGDQYRGLIQKARLDKSVKAIVLRVNSGGGSALASETIWRELSLAKKEKPVIVSFGDVAASGGYYISCAADSIFAWPTTITGSIGVFGIVPNMQSFFKNKLGVTFDGVNTAPYADAGAVYRPLQDREKKMVQSGIEQIYTTFKQRVADGRKKDTTQVENIAQGRVWTGRAAKEIGLIDKFGGLQDAVKSAAKMAGLKEYRVKEYPEPKSFFDRILGDSDPINYSSKIKDEVGAEHFQLYLELKRVKEMCNSIQASLPFRFSIY